MSNLFNQASLVLVPSGYKAGKVYSQVPTSGDGDLTFTRASDATRVNSDGLIEKVRTNLLLQSNQFDTFWTVSNTTLTSGQVGYDGTNNAWSHIPTATNASHRIIQSISTPASTAITYSVYAKANGYNFIRIVENATSGNFATFNLSTGVVANNTALRASIENVGNGWYRCNYTVLHAGISSRMDIYAMETASFTDFLANGTSGIFIQNAQAEVSDIATDYIPTTTTAVSVGMTANVPRLDYSQGSCPALLLEPQRTNLVLYSEEFNNSYWSKFSSTVTANDAIAPDGTITADLLICTTTGVGDIRPTPNNPYPTTGIYTFSIYVKPSVIVGNLLIRLERANNTANFSYNFNTGVFSATGANAVSGKIETASNGYVRLIATANITNTNFELSIGHFLSGGSSLDSATHIWGAQLE